MVVALHTIKGAKERGQWQLNLIIFSSDDDDDDDDDEAEEGNGQEKVSSHFDFFVDFLF